MFKELMQNCAQIPDYKPPDYLDLRLLEKNKTIQNRVLNILNYNER